MGRRRKAGHGGEFHMDERWAISYMDMVTVLMCLFIVLYAMSSIDKAKFKTLADSLATGFGKTKTEQIDATQGVVVPQDLVKKNGKGFTTSTGHEGTAEVAAKLKQALKKLGSTATVTIDSRGVVVGLVGSSTYFGGNDASLSPAAVKVLTAVAPVLDEVQEQITVEGFAEPKGSPGSFGTDWNLAGARALSVLGWFVDSGGVAGDRISATSYGSAHSKSGTNPATIEHNRRVDIVLHQSTWTPSAAASPSSAPTGAASPTAVPSATATHSVDVASPH